MPLLGLVAVAVRQELVLFIMGGVFVVETVSVIIQVASYKMTGRRIFRMAPLHHHFELKGWAEPKVIVRFWIITVILVLIGLGELEDPLMSGSAELASAGDAESYRQTATAARARSPAGGRVGGECAEGWSVERRGARA